MKRAGIVLLLAVAVAGCTGGPGGVSGGSDGPTVQGLVIDQARWSAAQVTEGGVANITVQVRNTNPRPVTEFTATLQNTAGLTTKKQKHQKFTPGRPCDAASKIEAATPDFQPQKICRWQVRAPSIKIADRKVFPVTVQTEYKTVLTARDASAKVEIESSGASTARSTVKRYGNGDIQAVLEYRPVVRESMESSRIRITVRNTGAGRLLSSTGGGVQNIKLDPEGTLFNTFTFGDKGQCAASGSNNNDAFTINIADGASTTVECQLKPKPKEDLAPGTTYTMRLPVTYKYQKSIERPLTVISVN